MTILEPLPIHYDADVNGLIRQIQSFQIFLLCAFNVSLDQASLSKIKNQASLSINMVLFGKFSKFGVFFWENIGARYGK